jgi:hypothetical protein
LRDTYVPCCWQLHNISRESEQPQFQRPVEGVDKDEVVSFDGRFPPHPCCWQSASEKRPARVCLRHGWVWMMNHPSPNGRKFLFSIKCHCPEANFCMIMVSKARWAQGWP